jgi:FKBP-type peptidyl-prolyl cis-trans isomerase FkpA
MVTRKRSLYLALTVLLTALGCSNTPTEPSTILAQGPATLQITELAGGSGAEAVTGSNVSINYTLWRYDPFGPNGKGLQVQTSVGGAPFAFVIGTSAVIPGVVQGITGMKSGGRRRVIVPPSLAYGATGTADGSVRPNEWIVFELELLSVQ